VYQALRADDGIHRAGVDAQGAADAAAFVDQRYGKSFFHAGV
jgi:hypothetical protein